MPLTRYGRERLPKLGETLDGFSLVDKLAGVLLESIGKFLLRLMLRHGGRAQRFFFLRTALPKGSAT